MSARVQYILSDEALEVINRSATERKRGEWISNAVIDYDAIKRGAVTPDTDGCEVGLLERIDTRLSRIERQLATIIVEQGKTLA
ncbi:MAG: hypothetical protein R3C14_22775 [Caldilineaceae bacterium]